MLNGMLTVPVMLQCATNVGPGVRSGSELDTRPAWLGVGSQYAAAGSLGSGPLRSFQEMAPHSLWHATGYDRKTDPVRVRLSSQIVFLTPSGKPFRLSIKDGCQERLGTAGKAGLTLASAGVQSAPFSLIRDLYYLIYGRAGPRSRHRRAMPAGGRAGDARLPWRRGSCLAAARRGGGPRGGAHKSHLPPPTTPLSPGKRGAATARGALGWYRPSVGVPRDVGC